MGTDAHGVHARGTKKTPRTDVKGECGHMYL